MPLGGVSCVEEGSHGVIQEKTRRGIQRMQFEELTGQVIGAAIDVHKEIGPGLLESTYGHCLAHELKLRQLPFDTEVPIPVQFKGITLDCGYKSDFIIAGILVVGHRNVLCNSMN